MMCNCTSAVVKEGEWINVRVGGQMPKIVQFNAQIVRLSMVLHLNIAIGMGEGMS